eukprot:10093704-Karenia_brevis.AAC.1
MLKALKKLGKRNGDSSSDSDAEERSNALSGVNKLRKNLRRKPQKVIRNYEARVRKDLGVRHDAQVWAYTDW